MSDNRTVVAHSLNAPLFSAASGPNSPRRPQSPANPEAAPPARASPGVAAERAAAAAQDRERKEAKRRSPTPAAPSPEKRAPAAASSPPRSKQPESGTSRRHRKRIYPSNPEKLQQRERNIRRRPSLPKQAKRNTAARLPPSHQLPKASSEAMLREKGDFTWAKNRVNPTAPKTIYQSSDFGSKKSRRRGSRQMLSFEHKVIAGIAALIIVALLVVWGSQRGEDQIKKPRFSDKPRTTQSSTSSSSRPSAKRTQKKATTKKKRSKPKKKRKTKVTKKKKQNKKPTRTSARKKKSQKKTKPRSAATLKSRSLKKSPPKTPRSSGPTVPSSWPRTRASSGSALQAQLLKVVSVTGLRLLEMPGNCQPCQIPAQLKDGTRVLLSSQDSSPWSGVKRTRSRQVNAKGLVTKSVQGYFTLIVQDLSP